MGDITTYQFNTHNIRVVTVEGEPWFVAADVCGILELAAHKGGYEHHLRKLDAVEKTRPPVSDTGGFNGARPVLISESGLYKLVLRSDKPQAKPFQDWVTKEVLPAIRKDGAYIAGEEKLRTGEMSEDGTEA